MSEIKLNIDGREVTAEPGQTVLQVALANGIPIPHLSNVGTNIRRPSEDEIEKIVPRAEKPILSIGKRRGSFAEVLCGLTLGRVCTETRRLRCDLERAEALGITH